MALPRAVGVRTRGSLPVRLVGGLGGSRRRAHQAAGCALQVELQPCLHRTGLSAANARDAVRRPQPRLPVLGGVPRRGIYDNMRTAVDRIGRGNERQDNARFPAMASHYLFEAEFCNPASGWEKGQVKKNVEDSRHRLWQPMPRFPSLEALNDWLEQRCRELWQQIPHGLRPETIEDIRAEEARFLMPMPRLFDGFVEYTKRVSPTCLVHLERNRYSVPASLANRPVSLRVYRLRLRQDDNRAARPPHPSLPHSGDRKRQFPPQEQLRPGHRQKQGESRTL